LHAASVILIRMECNQDKSKAGKPDLTVSPSAHQNGRQLETFRAINMKSVAIILAIVLSLVLMARTGVLNPQTPKLKPDLARHMILQLSSRTDGNSPDFTGPTDGSNYFQRPPTNTPNFWLRDVTNILAMSQGRLEAAGILSCANYISPVSPHICIAAAHTGGGVGTTNLWLLPDGTYYQNKITSSLAPTNIPDIVLMFMAKTNWTFLKIFPNAAGKMKRWQQSDPSNPVPVFVRFHQGIGRTNRFHTTFVSGSLGLGSFGPVSGQFQFGDYSKGDTWVAGDSSGAAYGIIQNEAALVCVASAGGGGAPIANFTNQINAAMATLCASNGIPVESLTLYDLSAFRDY
jgi:hypothetical protein